MSISPFLRPENMVHQTMAISSTKASKASSKIRPMVNSFELRSRHRPALNATGVILSLLLTACGSAPPRPDSAPAPAVEAGPPAAAAWMRPGSRWVPASWQELPGWGQDALHEAWAAALSNCERPPEALRRLCPEIRQMSLADDVEKRTWLQEKFQPYRIESHAGEASGLLTGYYEPLLEATRRPSAQHRHALYQMPAAAKGSKYTLTRKEIDDLGEAGAGLSGRQIAYLADPVDVLIIQIQGSARLWIREDDGSRRLVRLAFAGTNGQPYQSVARWLLDRGEIRDASWSSIKAWVVANAHQPGKVQAMFWSNPRVVFFREEPVLSDGVGPRGAQGIGLTAGRSVAVDRQSIPYGTPLWLASNGPHARLNRLVFAQDTGSAIVGAVRADYYAGTGDEAGAFAGRLKQDLRLWALWPVGSPP